MGRFPSTSAASSGRSAAAWSRCSSRSCATRSTPRPPAWRCRSRLPRAVRAAAARLRDARRAARAPARRAHGLHRLRAALGRGRVRAEPRASFLVVRALQGSANAFLTPLLLAGLADEVPPRPDRAGGRDVRGGADGGGRAGAAGRWCARGDRLAAGVPRPGRGRGRAGAAAAGRRRGARGRAAAAAHGLHAAGRAPERGRRSSATRASPASASSSRCWRRTSSGWPRSRAACCWRASGSRGSWSGGRRATRSTATGACRWRSSAWSSARRWWPCWGSRRRRSRWARCGSLTGLGSTLVWAGINTLAVEAVPGNRAGGTSVISAFRFAGNAAAPLMWLPLYHADHRLGFLGAGLFAVADRAVHPPAARAKVRTCCSRASATPSPPSSTRSARSSRTWPACRGRRCSWR